MYDHRHEFRMVKMAKVLDVSLSGYYAWRKRRKSKRHQENDNLLIAIRDIYHEGRKTYGSPSIWVELNKRGISCGKNRVARLMKNNGIYAVTKRRFKVTTDSRHKEPIAENLLKKGVIIQRPNRIWVSDITYIWTRERWMYLSVILDLHSRKIVGWSMRKHLRKELVTEALSMAYNRRKPVPGLIFHSDRGVQYASESVRSFLSRRGFVQSMSDKGNCYDNAYAESFFHTLKTELIYQNNYQTREDAKQDIFEYIEVFYNRKRRHSALGYLSPEQFEKRYLRIAA